MIILKFARLLKKGMFTYEWWVGMLLRVYT